MKHHRLRWDIRPPKLYEFYFEADIPIEIAFGSILLNFILIGDGVKFPNNVVFAFACISGYLIFKMMRRGEADSFDGYLLIHTFKLLLVRTVHTINIFIVEVLSYNELHPFRPKQR